MRRDEDRPLICISLDPHWAYRFGFDWLTYRRLIRRAGGRAKTVFYHRHGDLVESLQFDPARHESFDGLLLGGGVDVDPSRYRLADDESAPTDVVHGSNRRDEFELRLVRQSMSVGRPILGICRGCQLLNVAVGGTLRVLSANRIHRHVARCWQHPVAIRRGSRLGRAVGKTRIGAVRSIHSEVIENPGQGVEVVARSPDGIPEAIEVAEDRVGSDFCLGVQWHPELAMWGNQDLPLIRAFVDAAREFRER